MTVDLAAATLGTNKPLAPLEDGGVGALVARELGGIRLGLMAAIPAPDDKPSASSSGIAERVIGGPGTDFIGSWSEHGRSAYREASPWRPSSFVCSRSYRRCSLLRLL